MSTAAPGSMPHVWTSLSLACATSRREVPFLLLLPLRKYCPESRKWRISIGPRVSQVMTTLECFGVGGRVREGVSRRPWMAGGTGTDGIIPTGGIGGIDREISAEAKVARCRAARLVEGRARSQSRRAHQSGSGVGPPRGRPISHQSGCSSPRSRFHSSINAASSQPDPLEPQKLHSFWRRACSGGSDRRAQTDRARLHQACGTPPGHARVVTGAAARGTDRSSLGPPCAAPSCSRCHGYGQRRSRCKHIVAEAWRGRGGRPQKRFSICPRWRW
jgi:hypothetical protein